MNKLTLYSTLLYTEEREGKRGKEYRYELAVASAV